MLSNTVSGYRNHCWQQILKWRDRKVFSVASSFGCRSCPHVVAAQIVVQAHVDAVEILLHVDSFLNVSS